MPSIRRPPRGPWIKVWALAAALIVGHMTALEIFWRDRGHQPGVSPSLQLWCYHRERVQGAGHETLAVLGASRMQVGFIQEAFLEVHPDIELVQLAVPAKGPVAALAELASDQEFRGLVLCSIEEVSLQPVYHNDQMPYVAYWREKWGPGKKVSLVLAATFQEWLAQLQPRLGGEHLVSALAQGRLPLVPYYHTQFNRQRTVDYSDVNVRQLIDTRVNYLRRELTRYPPATPEVWQEVVAQLAGYVREIHARGGKVAFVKFPLTGRLLDLEAELLPRGRYWDVLAAGLGTDVIHYEEMPGIDSLQLPDDSHLDPEGAVAFTRWLAQQLEQRGFFR